MARDPNERRSSSLIEKADEVPSGVVLPPQVKAAGIGTGNGQYYAYRVIYADGRSEIEWYKRGSGGGPDQPDPVELRTEAPVATAVKAEWDKGEEKEEDAARPPGGIPTRAINGQVFAWNPSTRAYDIPTGQAPVGAGSQAAAPGGKPFIDDGPDARENGRRWGWNDQTRLYDRDLGPSPTAQEIIRNRSLPPDQDPRAETDAERAARAKEQESRAERNRSQKIRAPVDGHPGIYFVTTKNPQTGLQDAHYENEAGQRVPQPAAAPSYNVTHRVVNGQQYTVIVKTPKDGSQPTIAHYGPDGKPIAALPSEGEASVGGPKMPQIVAAESEKGLIALHQALAADPSLTPAQRETYFQQAVQIATIANQNAATLQRERESQRNTDYNVATTTYRGLQSGLADALKFVGDLNGTLPEGSDLGGKAFAALMGMQMLMLERSRLQELGQPARGAASGTAVTPTAAAPPVPSIQPADLTDPSRLEAKRAEIMANPVFRPQPPVDVPPSSPPAVPGIPSVVGDTGAPAVPSVATSPAPPMRDDWRVNPGAPVTGAPAAPAPSPATTPDYGAPGMRVLPDPQMPVNVPYPSNAGAVSSAPAGPDFPVLAQQRQQPSMAPVPTGGHGEDARFFVPGASFPYDVGRPNPPIYDDEGVDITNTRLPQSTDPGWHRPMPWDRNLAPDVQMKAPPVEHPAVLASRVASSPPWRLDDQTIEQALAAGVDPETIWGVPGRRVG